MLTKLYNAVFETENSGFDMHNHFYTVLLNFTDDDFCGGQIGTSMNRYLSKNSYEICRLPLSDRTKTDLMGYLETRHADAREYSISTCFTLLLDYKDTDLSGYIKDCVELMYEANFVSNRDKVVVMAAFPDDTALATSYIKKLESAVNNTDVEFYFFIKGKYTASQLVDDISGTMLLNSDKNIYSKAVNNFAATKQAVDTAVMAFPEAGRQKIQQMKKMMWSTVTVSYNDDKMDFLRYYMHRLYDNAACFSNVNLEDVCSKFYEMHLHTAHSDDRAYLNALINKLYYAVKITPKVNNISTDEPMSLNNYFNAVYAKEGFGGSKVVELTLKVNLKKHNSFTYQLVLEAANHLYSIATQYHSNDIQTEIFTALDRYLEKLENMRLEKRKELNQKMDKSTDVQSAMRAFVEEYVEYDDFFKKQEFWREVMMYIRRNASVFSGYEKQCCEMLDAFNKNKAKLNYYAEMNVKDNFGAFSAKTLLYPEQDERFCNMLRAAYSRYLNDVSENAPVIPRSNRSFDVFFNVNPGFVHDYPYTFTVGNTFSVVINHRIGQYFMFGE